MKIIIWVFIVFKFLSVTVFAQEMVQEQAEAAGWGKTIEYYNTAVAPFLRENGLDFDLEKMTESIYKREFKLSPMGIINGAISLFTGCIKGSAVSIGLVVMLSVLCGFLNNLNFTENSDGSSASFYICFCVICIICAEAFTKSVENGIYAISIMGDFIKIASPVLLTLVLSSGQAMSAAVFSPVLSSAAMVSVTISSQLLPSLIYGSFSLSALNCIGDGINLERISRLLKSIAKWIMGFSLTMFSGLSALGAVTSGAMNAALGKAVKFAVGNFIPVVGGLLSDSLDMVISCTSVVKGAVGAGVMVVIILVFASCGVQLIAQLWLFRISAAITAPVGDIRIIKLLDDIADCISLVFSALCTCSFLFLIVITALVIRS